MLKRWRRIFNDCGYPHAHLSDDALEAQLIAMHKRLVDAIRKFGVSANKLSKAIHRTTAAMRKVDG